MIVKSGEDGAALVLRRHPSSLLGPYIRSALVSLVGIILLFNFKGRIATVLSLLMVFLAISYALYEFVIWYYDIVVITKNRLLDVNQQSLFRRELKEVSLSKVSNIKIMTTGLFGSLFGFGTVVLSTPSGEMFLEDLKNPQEIKNVLEKLSAKSSLSANELIEYIVQAKAKLK